MLGWGMFFGEKGSGVIMTGYPSVTLSFESEPEGSSLRVEDGTGGSKGGEQTTKVLQASNP